MADSLTEVLSASAHELPHVLPVFPYGVIPAEDVLTESKTKKHSVPELKWREQQFFFNLNLEVTYYPFCHILPVIRPNLIICVKEPHREENVV